MKVIIMPVRDVGYGIAERLGSRKTNRRLVIRYFPTTLVQG